MTKPTIALLGTGILGRAMGERLLAQGFPLRAWNRTPSKARALEPLGAEVAATPGEACRGARAVLTVVADGPALEAVLFGPQGAAGELSPGAVLIQASTVSPTENQDLARRLSSQGALFLEAPVLGSRKEAVSGRLLVMAAGSGAAAKEAAPVVAALAEKVVYTGPVGSAAVVKLALNQMIACLMGTLAQALVMVENWGVPRETFVEILRPSALWAPMFEKKLGTTLARGNFEDPNFPLRHLLKDLRLVLEVGRLVSKPLPLAEACERMLEEAEAKGLGDLDYSALYLFLQRKSLTRKSPSPGSPGPEPPAGPSSPPSREDPPPERPRGRGRRS